MITRQDDYSHERARRDARAVIDSLASSATDRVQAWALLLALDDAAKPGSASLSPQDDVMDAIEVAELLGVSKSYIVTITRGAEGRPKLKSFMQGRLRRYWRSDVVEYTRECSIPATERAA